MATPPSSSRRAPRGARPPARRGAAPGPVSASADKRGGPRGSGKTRDTSARTSRVKAAGGARRDGFRRDDPRDDGRRREDARPSRSKDRSPVRSSDARPSDARGERRRDARPARDGDDRRAGARERDRPGRTDASRSPTRESPRRGAPESRRTPTLSPEERKRELAAEHARDKGWGSVARKGAVNLNSTGNDLGEHVVKSRTPDPLGDWVVEERPARSTPSPSRGRATASTYALPGDVAADVRRAFVGTAYAREKTVATLTRAAEAYDRHRYEEALRLGRTVADVTPGVAVVRELTGLAAYRAERWSMAKVHLRAHFALTGDPEHLPLVMDADRANAKYRAVEKTFAELEASEPTAEVLAEARIVLAASWADQRRYDEATELLVRAGAAKNLRNPSYRHVRLWYALADVLDRAGDTSGAREIFARIALAEPDAYDVRARLAELGSSARPKSRRRRATPVSKKKVN